MRGCFQSQSSEKKQRLIKMQPKTILIRRKFNLGNFQTIDIQVEASVDQNEDPITALAMLEKIINDYWEGRTDKLVSMAYKEKKE